MRSVGTRGSDLALTQARSVMNQMRARGIPNQEKIIVTKGDRDARPFRELQGDGFFTKELEMGLFRDEIQYAIHSAKDLPSLTHRQLPWVAFGARESAADYLVASTEVFEILRASGFFKGEPTHHGKPGGAGPNAKAWQRPLRIGTGSPRRTAQLRRDLESLRLEVEVVPLRGNVPTRVGKVRSGDLDAVVLAEAGLNRLRHLELLQGLKGQALTWTTAPCQGILALQSRRELWSELSELANPELAEAAQAEKAMLAILGGGCHLALGAHLTRQTSRVRFDFFVDEGRAVFEGSWQGDSPAEVVRSAYRGLVGAESLANAQPNTKHVILTGLIQGALKPGRLSANRNLTPELWPLIDSAPSFDIPERDWVLSRWSHFDGIVVASPMGARLALLEIFAQLPPQALRHRMPIYAVGETTARVLAPLNWDVEIPRDFGSQGLVQHIHAHARHGIRRLLFLGARDSVMVRALREAGYDVHHYELYSTEESQHFLSQGWPQVNGPAHVVVASPSAARIFVERRKRDPSGYQRSLQSAQFWAMGETTLRALHKLGVEARMSRESGNWESLIDDIANS